jgi:hypothetical protein
MELAAKVMKPTASDSHSQYLHFADREADITAFDIKT